MKRNYIQLPPLPADMPFEAMKLIWQYAKMPAEKRGMFLEFIEKSVDEGMEELLETELSKRLNDTDGNADADVAEYAEYMKRFLAMLFSQACETAGFVYQHYCVEGKSLEEIAKEYDMDDTSLRLITQYYDRTERNKGMGKKSFWKKN